MGLFKRGTVWWMRFTHKGKKIRRSTEVSEKKLAEKIHAKVLTQIAEGKWLDIDPATSVTFAELMEIYIREQSPKKAEGSTKRDHFTSVHLLKFFRGFLLSEITPGTKIDQGNMRADFIKVRKIAGLDDVRFHDLRHTFATRLVQSGVDLYKVQRLLGHKKSPAMTQRYAHHYPESLRGAVDILAESFKSRGTIGAQSAPIENKGLKAV